MSTLSEQTKTSPQETVRRLPDSTRISYAHFRVSDIDQALGFYVGLLGLVETAVEGGTRTLSATGSAAPLVVLTEDRGAKQKPVQSPGLFHLALLYPERRNLAASFKRLYAKRWPFHGFADHGVSEALYLADPDGNGIEMYVDRPREQWPYRNGELAMVTEQLDIDNLMAELNGTDQPDIASSNGLTIGHIHLQVSDLHQTDEFYHKTLGFDVVQRSFPGALFMSAAGYHHHIGANVWNSRGSAPVKDGALGLVQFGISLGGEQSHRELEARLRPSANWVSETGKGFVVRDADHIQIEIS